MYLMIEKNPRGKIIIEKRVVKKSLQNTVDIALHNITETNVLVAIDETQRASIVVELKVTNKEDLLISENDLKHVINDVTESLFKKPPRNIAISYYK